VSETQLVKAILDALKLEPGVVAWRNSVGSRGFRKFGLGTGSADIIAVVAPYGRFVGIETKAADGILSEPQYYWGLSVRECGGIYGVAYSVAEARNLIHQARSSKAYSVAGCQGHLVPNRIGQRKELKRHG
jgi:hypothetical protein